MLFTRQNAMENIRNRDGKRVFFLGKGDQLTNDARDWLRSQRIEILSAEQAKPARWQLAGGGFCEEKPEHMTHLNGQTLVPKTHPRIAFRGAMDMVEAELLLCLQETGENRLQQILDQARELLRCDVLEEPVEEKPLCGLDQMQLRHRSHFPQKYYDQPHFMPSAQDKKTVLLLNKARCLVRWAELLAVAAFSDREGNPTRLDILQAMNRMSSMLYILMIEHKKQE